MRSLLSLFLALLLTLPLLASPIAIEWSSSTAGLLDGVAVSLTGIETLDLGVLSSDLSGANFAAAPLATNQSTVPVGASNNWNASFASPVSDLLLYAASWRGAFFFGRDDSVSYTFNVPFTVLSGFNGATVVGNTLTLTSSRADSRFFFSGLLRFDGPISTLSVSSVGAPPPPDGQSAQLLTFAIASNEIP